MSGEDTSVTASIVPDTHTIGFLKQGPAPSPVALPTKRISGAATYPQVVYQDPRPSSSGMDNGAPPVFPAPPPAYIGEAAPAPPPGYPGAASSAAAAPGDGAPETSSRGVTDKLQAGLNVVRKIEHTAHMVAHPTEAIRYNTTGRMKRLMHRAVDKYCCSIQ